MLVDISKDIFDKAIVNLATEQTDLASPLFKVKEQLWRALTLIAPQRRESVPVAAAAPAAAAAAAPPVPPPVDQEEDRRMVMPQLPRDRKRQAEFSPTRNEKRPNEPPTMCIWVQLSEKIFLPRSDKLSFRFEKKAELSDRRKNHTAYALLVENGKSAVAMLNQLPKGNKYPEVYFISDSWLSDEDALDEAGYEGIPRKQLSSDVGMAAQQLLTILESSTPWTRLSQHRRAQARMAPQRPAKPISAPPTFSSGSSVAKMLDEAAPKALAARKPATELTGTTPNAEMQEPQLPQTSSKFLSDVLSPLDNHLKSFTIPKKITNSEPPAPEDHVTIDDSDGEKGDVD